MGRKPALYTPGGNRPTAAARNQGRTGSTTSRNTGQSAESNRTKRR